LTLPFPDASGFTPRVGGGSAFFVGHMRKPIKITVVVFMALVVISLASWHVLTAAKRFLRPVKTGMSQNRVRSLLGSPTYTSIPSNGNGAEVWEYHRWWMGDAIVYYDTNRLVTWVEVEL
jgi:hypothetical protein